MRFPGSSSLHFVGEGPQQIVVTSASAIEEAFAGPCGMIGFVRPLSKVTLDGLGNAFVHGDTLPTNHRRNQTAPGKFHEPNALNADEAQRFLNCMRDEFPQHYAMTYLGFATGLRPSSLRPLRRKGATPDVLWDEAAILVRRSHTLGEEVMQKTKTGLRQRINLPRQALDVLRWHVDTQLETPEQLASELLFPRNDGGFRSESALKKAFAEVGRAIGLKKKFSPRGMRRTFNDLARAAKVESLVTKSISGHLTDRMKDHYSTVSPIEQRESIGRVLALVQGETTPSGAPASGAPGGAPTSASGAPEGAQPR
jgi:integrase